MGAETFNSVPKTYFGINQGKLKVKVDKDTPNAIRREYTDPKDETKTTKEVWELHYKSIEGFVYKIESVVKDFGLVWNITLMDEAPDQPLMILSLMDGNAYITDLFKKLPGVFFGDLIKLQPYEVEKTDDKGNKTGKFNRGITVIQEGRKLENFFYDKENKCNINGFPDMEEEKPDKDDWKMYFIKVNKFLKKYLIDNVLPILETDGVEKPSDKPVNSNNTPAPVRTENHTPVEYDIPSQEEDDLPF